jgi:anti-sigma factor RsiW
VATIEFSCVEIWRELSNYIDDDAEPALRQRMDEHFKRCKHCVAVLDGTRNVSAWSAMAVRLICAQDLASA